MFSSRICPTFLLAAFFGGAMNSVWAQTKQTQELERPVRDRVEAPK